MQGCVILSRRVRSVARASERVTAMSRTQIVILVVLGMLVVAVFGKLGATVYDTMSQHDTALVANPELSASPAPAMVTASIEKLMPAGRDSGERNETTRQAETLLRELGYHVIGVEALTNEAGDRTLAAYVRGSYTGAEDALIEINSVVSLYVTATSPPFDSASVAVYSPEDEVIIASVVMREDVEAWLNGRISTDQFVGRIVIQSQ